MQTITLLLALLGLQAVRPFDCEWKKPVQVGVLDAAIGEASGLAISRRIPDRLYHINDSDKSGRFFITNLKGGSTRAIRVAGFKPQDTEDLALGPCGENLDCLFIGDIGDNDSLRSDVEILVIEERAEFPAEAVVRTRVRVRYPDGPHDAESMAVHPDGSIYVLTKNLQRRGFKVTAGPAHLYRLKRNQWNGPKNPIQTMESVATLDFATLLPRSLAGGRLPTGMHIASDASRVLVLTYQDAVEFQIDLPVLPKTGAWKEGRHYRRIPLEILPQQEAISYLPDGKAFLYTTERLATAAPRIMKVQCLK